MEDMFEMDNSLHQNILENLPVIAAFLKPDREIIWANKMCRDFAGLSCENSIGKECFMMWRLKKPCTGCPALRVIETGKPAVFEIPDMEQPYWPDTQGRWKIQLIPVDNNGHVTGIIEVASEITSDQEVRHSLRKSEERLRQAEELAHIGHWELDLKTNQLFWSDEIYNIFEIDPRQFGASYEAFLESAHPDDRDKIHSAYTESLKNKTPYQIEHRLLLPDGRIKYIQERCRNYYDQYGNQVRSLGTVQDITAQKNMEIENERLQHQFNQAQKMESIGRLAGGVAHDYNNISGIIMGYSEMALQDLAPTNPMHEYFTAILNAAQKSANITRQLLAFARKQIIAPKLVDINKTLAELLKMLGRLVGEDIKIEFIPDAKPWPIKIDPSQIDQIMVNLCINARDAIGDVGKITIETSNTCFDETYCSRHLGFIPGDYVLISVSDNGCGISPETIDNIFEPFFTTKDIGKGTGLGLATVYGIVKQNMGFINVYSEPREGTVIKIYLPKCSGEVGYKKPGEVIDIPLSRGESVLLVEDDISIRVLVNKFLLQMGYSVLSAGSPGEAIEKAKGHKASFDLLITDVVMPEMNGRILSDTLLTYYPDMKTLYISGYTANVIATRGVLHDGMFFLSKPFSKKELAFKIRQVLDEGNKQ
jgi:two-component system, cell cycle sensor histidine kinase and response regulator CckA